jgi:hypothetical protein
METIDVCKKYGIKGVLASIDQTRALTVCPTNTWKRFMIFLALGNDLRNGLEL